jgi:uncharacterized protein YdhG (YjbR/CyaY superfamily)
MKEYTIIDEYISGFPKEVQVVLQKFRKTIHKAVPEATEAISYGIPTFKLKGNLVHFGGFKQHVGFYPSPSGIDAFKEELSPYLVSKGTIHFALDKPIPYDLITKIVLARKREMEVKRLQKEDKSKK